ncbi:MAG: hypothetical protein KGY67_00245 [Candidatus Thermoplasmatota archaeon]|nr:hypothetical protein [Candidatus Thermoplasmatota archaeon]
MPRTANEYPEEIVTLSKSAMLELWRGLHRYNRGITLIGGWVPYFLLEKYGGTSYEHDHIGSIDIDIALNETVISEEEYANIEQLVQNLGYRHKLDSDNNHIPFVFLKDFYTSNNAVTIEVDFVGSYYGNKGHRHKRVSGLLARKCHGVDIVFDNYIEEQINGKFPRGGNASEIIRIANLIASLTMKGIVLGERYKEKDAYDIYYLITNYKRGPVDAANEINQHIQNVLVNEALTIIKKDFADRESSGPAWVASFLNEEAEERERRITDVYMNVNEFLDKIKEN